MGRIILKSQFRILELLKPAQKVSHEIQKEVRSCFSMSVIKDVFYYRVDSTIFNGKIDIKNQRKEVFILESLCITSKKAKEDEEVSVRVSGRPPALFPIQTCFFNNGIYSWMCPNVNILSYPLSNIEIITPKQLIISGIFAEVYTE